MIGHQAVGVKEKREPGFLVGELEEEFAIVVIGPEDELAVIPPRDNVIKPALDFESRLAHCGRSLAKKPGRSQIAYCMPDPSRYSGHNKENEQSLRR